MSRVCTTEIALSMLQSFGLSLEDWKWGGGGLHHHHLHPTSHHPDHHHHLHCHFDGGTLGNGWPGDRQGKWVRSTPGPWTFRHHHHHCHHEHDHDHHNDPHHHLGSLALAWGQERVLYSALLLKWEWESTWHLAKHNKQRTRNKSQKIRNQFEILKNKPGKANGCRHCKDVDKPGQKQRREDVQALENNSWGFLLYENILHSPPSNLVHVNSCIKRML